MADGPHDRPRVRPQGPRYRAADPGRRPRLEADRLRSSATILPTYLEWDREVLEECYDQVDAISLHNYYGNTPEPATTCRAISR